mmetsp:Transcript_18365/g.27888  ORF Transcript_18365/g.27888 Transcript_18365/m.27888 type:complete len:218 (-) Transcript_18365:665-1318(-)
MALDTKFSPARASASELIASPLNAFLMRPFVLAVELKIKDTHAPMDAAMPSPSATLITSTAEVGIAASYTLIDMASNVSIPSSIRSIPSSVRSVVSAVADKDNKSRMKASVELMNAVSSPVMARVAMMPMGTVMASVDMTDISKSVRSAIISSHISFGISISISISIPIKFFLGLELALLALLLIVALFFRALVVIVGAVLFSLIVLKKFLGTKRKP